MTRIHGYYVAGRLGPYFTPTIGHVDKELLLLSILLDSPTPAATPERVRSDMDALLDRRQLLAAAQRPRTKEAA